MLRRRHINADPEGSGLRSAVEAAVESLRDLAGLVEERVLWRSADLLRGAAEVARWPLERLAWIGERRLLWPLQERTAGWGPSGRAAGAGALASLAIGAGAIGAVSLSGNEGDPGRVAAPARLAAVADPVPAPTEAPTGRTLQGVPPSFGVDEGVRLAAKSGEPVESPPGTSPGDAAASDDPAAATSEEATATASRERPVPAGPAAMKVARRFAEAFVFYEIGERPARTRTVFEETSTPRLATALSERPPRQPVGVDVPQARVLNLVPGPRRGRTYTVSASLLRVGTTSELRLEMRKERGTWRITDVRG